MNNWSVEDANRLYKIDKWGVGYFEVNGKGNICVKPSADSDHKVDLKMLVEELIKRKINPPILVRFMDILKDRIAQICDSFNEAVKINDYKGRYYPLFPIKVNQERDVVNAILDYGKPHGLGLEAGSKAELLIVLALTTDLETPIVCNGYKDREFVALVGMAHKIGKRIFPVIENYGEVETFIRHYHKTGIMPNIGIRIKPSTKGEGKWAKTGGANSKFGLRIPEVMKAVSRLKQENLLGSLKLLHFHIGSQVTKITVVKKAIVETMRVYVELCRLGAPMEVLDIGGGLGVDYDGSSSDTHSTINYSLDEYANDIVYRIKQLCDEHRVPHPTIFSESGRFLSAHYSMLITNVPATSSFDPLNREPPAPEKSFGPVHELYEILENMSEDNLLECFHDASQYETEVQNLFNLGYLSLPERSEAEELYWQVMRQISQRSREAGLNFSELDELEDRLADTYFANFSLFQSLPDSWAIGQIFPVIPIHRLDERPTQMGVIADLTCDSDGIIGGYLGDKESNASLPLHRICAEKPYYIGIFLVGAYQETLGEMHNLFGDSHAVQINILGSNRYKISNFTKGDTIHQVIGFVSYSSRVLIGKMREQIEGAVERKKLSLDESAQMMEQYEEGLHGYTYFED